MSLPANIGNVVRLSREKTSRLTLSTLILGIYGHLAVVIRKYTPDVKCAQEFQAPDYPPLCRDMLGALPVSLDPVVFGRKGKPGVQWPVPWTYHASTCNWLQLNDFGVELLETTSAKCNLYLF